MSPTPGTGPNNLSHNLPEVSQLAITVWKAYKEAAPDKLKPLSQELASLHIVLKEAESQVRQNALEVEAHARLEAMLRDTREVLEDLELFRVESMSASNNARGSASGEDDQDESGARSKEEDLEELRVNVVSNTNGILALIGNTIKYV